MKKFVLIAFFLIGNALHATITQEHIESWVKDGCMSELHRAVFEANERRVCALLRIRPAYIFVRDHFKQLPFDIAFTCYIEEKDVKKRRSYEAIAALLSPKA